MLPQAWAGIWTPPNKARGQATTNSFNSTLPRGRVGGQQPDPIGGDPRGAGLAVSSRRSATRFFTTDICNIACSAEAYIYCRRSLIDGNSYAVAGRSRTLSAGRLSARKTVAVGGRGGAFSR